MKEQEMSERLLRLFFETGHRGLSFLERVFFFLTVGRVSAISLVRGVLGGVVDPHDPHGYWVSTAAEEMLSLAA